MSNTKLFYLHLLLSLFLSILMAQIMVFGVIWCQWLSYSKYILFIFICGACFIKYKYIKKMVILVIWLNILLWWFFVIHRFF
ncbi:MAG: hypothetical protein ACD_71C00102G0002 [uncultured bacterium (gcode 4)]|uniref:Uncharacterized protein n=1 Tax=uncultured bacterium (gcode 4) TaxID=1234023 RepID=K1YNL9_9BACT|nr:MAG: hypothetical protein ACD_71C00102G0002 [uncultured bacterium (gcode 4)]